MLEKAQTIQVLLIQPLIILCLPSLSYAIWHLYVESGCHYQIMQISISCFIWVFYWFSGQEIKYMNWINKTQIFKTFKRSQTKIWMNKHSYSLASFGFCIMKKWTINCVLLLKYLSLMSFRQASYVTKSSLDFPTMTHMMLGNAIEQDLLTIDWRFRLQN